MENKKESFKEFKKRVVHKEDALFAILFLNPITVRIAYLLKKWNVNVHPNQVTLTRMFLFPPLIIFLLFLAPILKLRILYLFVAILYYFLLLTDWLDGQIARGSNKTSTKGVFLDAMADRSITITFFVLVFSIGLWTNNTLLLFGSILLFVLKTFYLGISIQAFHSREVNRKVNYVKKVFVGHSSLKEMKVLKINPILYKLNRILKIKRWGSTIQDAERHFLTVIFPSLLMVFNLEIFASFLLYFLVVLFLIYFLICIKNFFKGIE